MAVIAPPATRGRWRRFVAGLASTTAIGLVAAACSLGAFASLLFPTRRSPR